MNRKANKKKKKCGLFGRTFTVKNQHNRTGQDRTAGLNRKKKRILFFSFCFVRDENFLNWTGMLKWKSVCSMASRLQPFLSFKKNTILLHCLLLTTLFTPISSDHIYYHIYIPKREREGKRERERWERRL